MPLGLHRYIKYNLLGSVASGVDILILYMLTRYAGIHYLVSAALSFTAGVLVNHLINILWVFEKRSCTLRLEIMIIVGISSAGLIATELIVGTMVECCGMHYMAAKLFAFALVSLWNYYSRSKWVFAS